MLGLRALVRRIIAGQGFERRKLCSALSLGVASLVTMSPAWGACFGYYCTDTVSVFLVDANEARVQLTGGTGGLTNCTTAGGYLTLPKTNPNYASFYALMLAARMQGMPLTFRTNDGSNNCSVNYVYIE